MCILEVYNIAKAKKDMFYKMKYFPQANVAIPAEHFLEGPLSNPSLHFVAGENLVVHINLQFFCLVKK